MPPAKHWKSGESRGTGAQQFIGLERLDWQRGWLEMERLRTVQPKDEKELNLF